MIDWFANVMLQAVDTNPELVEMLSMVLIALGVACAFGLMYVLYRLGVRLRPWMAIPGLGLTVGLLLGAFMLQHVVSGAVVMWALLVACVCGLVSAAAIFSADLDDAAAPAESVGPRQKPLQYAKDVVTTPRAAPMRPGDTRPPDVPARVDTRAACAAAPTDVMRDQTASRTAPANVQTMTRSRAFEPVVDMEETDDAIVIRAQGLGESPDVSLQVERATHTLTLHATLTAERTEAQRHAREAIRHQFRLTLPQPVCAQQATTRRQDGVVEITMPKEKQAARRGSSGSATGASVRIADGVPRPQDGGTTRRPHAPPAVRPDAVTQHYQLHTAWWTTNIRYITIASTGQHLYTLRPTRLILITRARYTLYDASGRVFLRLVQDHTLWFGVVGLFVGPRRLGQLRALGHGNVALEFDGWPPFHCAVGLAGEGTFAVECEGTPRAWVTKHRRHWDITIAEATPHRCLLTFLSYLYPGYYPPVYPC